MNRPLVNVKLLIEGKIRLRDIEEIMMKIRDEFGITSFKLQIDSHSYDYYQDITLEDVNRLRKRDSKGRYIKETLVITEGKDK